jgi:hypothetical protein
MTVATFQPAQVNLNVAANTATVIGGYTVPTPAAAIVTGGTITNKSASAGTVSVTVWNGSADIAYILYQVPIAANGSVVFSGADSKWTLGTGQGIRFTCTQIADAVMGVMQVQ